VVTIQDVIYRIYPEAHAGVRAQAMGVLVPLAARRSHRVIAPSVSTRNDLTQLLHVPLEKIDVTPYGVHPPRHALRSVDETRNRLELGTRPAVLSVSALRPHKNIPRLLEGIASIPAELRPWLLLPGYATSWEDDLRRRAANLGVEHDTRFLGWVTSEELEELYEVASCFVFPSLYEGFGFPVLEAMARGVPVACSDRGSLAEVAGDAALVFDPEDPSAIAASIETLLSNPSEAARLRAAGLARAAEFTWRETALATAAVYRRALA
jgi:glycosyltransferase involved in cell wall biosynthesis